MQVIVNKIIQQFPSEYARPRVLPITAALVLAADKQQELFWLRHGTDASFCELIYSTYAHKRQRNFFDFWQSSLELKPYLQPQFANAEMLLLEDDKASCLSVKQIEKALSEADNFEQFQALILEVRDYKQNMWLELENKLNTIQLERHVAL